MQAWPCMQPNGPARWHHHNGAPTALRTNSGRCCQSTFCSCQSTFCSCQSTFCSCQSWWKHTVKFGRDFTLWHATQPSNRVLTSSKNKLVCALFQHTVSSLRLGLNKDMNWEVGSTGHKWRRIIRDCHSTVDSLLEYSVQWWAKNQYECSRTSRIRSFPNAISSFVDCGNEFATAPNTQVLERHTSSSYIV